MKLCLQDPQYINSKLLHEELLQKISISKNGIGIYAFASEAGIQLLLYDKVFSEFINKNRYTLIVGMDAITNVKAINKLIEAKKLYGDNLEVYAFLHNTRNSTFHPKYSLFEADNTGSLIIGSGNLTENGLRRNREAFFVTDLDSSDLYEVQREIKGWLAANKENIRQIDDELVRKKAEENERMRNIQKGAAKQFGIIESNTTDEVLEESIVESDDAPKVENDNIEDDNTLWRIHKESKILIAEIPRSGNRWKQANFDRNTFENYFGATCGISGIYRILLRYINHSGVLGNIESRPGVSVSSQNYRFELDAAGGLAYPTNGSPIAIFAKVDTRTFIYELYMPNDDYYNNILNILDTTQPRVGDRKRRIIYNVDTLISVLPNLKIWTKIGDKNFGDNIEY